MCEHMKRKSRCKECNIPENLFCQHLNVAPFSSLHTPLPLSPRPFLLHLCLLWSAQCMRFVTFVTEVSLRLLWSAQCMSCDADPCNDMVNKVDMKGKIMLHWKQDTPCLDASEVSM